MVIDPTVTVAAYFSGSYQDVAYGIGHDSHGLVYIGSTTQSIDIPLGGGSLQTAEGGDQRSLWRIVETQGCRKALRVSSM